MKSNTIVTVSDRNYLWGVFLLIVSMRRSGMDEPVIVYGPGYGSHDGKVLEALGDVRVVSSGLPARSLTCSKAEAMLLAETDYVTWVDCDGFFTGNVSAFLPPPAPGEIHIRMRSEAENVAAFNGHLFGSDGRSIPPAILEQWRRDVPGAAAKPANPRGCSACLFSLHRSHRDFLEMWRDQMNRVLPTGNVGVVDPRLPYYHQLDESVLNSLLCFLPGAPKATATYRLDKDPDALFVHFVCQPKPWAGWTPASFPHYDRYLDVVDYAVSSGLELPGPLPFSLRRKNRLLCRILCRPVFYRRKVRRLLQKLKGRN